MKPHRRSSLPLAGTVPTPEQPKPPVDCLSLEGSLMTSFSMLGDIHLSLASGNFSAREVNEALHNWKGQQVRITVEAIQ